MTAPPYIVTLVPRPIAVAVARMLGTGGPALLVAEVDKRGRMVKFGWARP